MVKKIPSKSSRDASASSPVLRETLSGARILFLIDELEAITAGGSERQLLQMVDICKQCGMQPQICVLRNTKWLTEEIAGCPVAYFQITKIASWKGYRSLLDLRWWIVTQKFDILQTMFTDANLIGPIVGRLARVRVIIGTRRNLNHALTNTSERRFLRSQGLVNHLVSEIVVNSSAVQKRIAETEKTSPNRISVVYNGIDLDQMHPMPDSRAASRLALGIEEDQILVGNVSGLRKIKGVQMFVNAAVEIYRHDPRYRFILVGDGELNAQLRQTIRMYGLEKVIRLVGAAEDVRPYLAAFDIGVLCSHAEGFSNSLLEYMACGIPVIATDVGGNREALGATGILIQPNEQELIEAIYKMSDPDIQSGFAKAALKRAQTFDVRIARQNMMELYARLLTSEHHAQQPSGRIMPPHAGEAA